MKHKITIRCENARAGLSMKRHLRRCIRGALEQQGVIEFDEDGNVRVKEEYRNGRDWMQKNDRIVERRGSF